jgi:hypothetical protein
MAHFAQLNSDNTVHQVIVISNSITTILESGDESEQLGIDFCKQLYGQDSEWVQTSYNGNFRKRYAFPGYLYDEGRDAFLPPSPYPSWVLDEVTLDWVAPVSRPDDSSLYIWNEEIKSWVLFSGPTNTEDAN